MSSDWRKEGEGVRRAVLLCFGSQAPRSFDAKTLQKKAKHLWLRLVLKPASRRAVLLCFGSQAPQGFDAKALEAPPADAHARLPASPRLRFIHQESFRNSEPKKLGPNSKDG
jgi:hypothetical protein